MQEYAAEVGIERAVDQTGVDVHGQSRAIRSARGTATNLLPVTGQFNPEPVIKKSLCQSEVGNFVIGPLPLVGPFRQQVEIVENGPVLQLAGAIKLELFGGRRRFESIIHRVEHLGEGVSVGALTIDHHVIARMGVPKRR